ncbi:MAG: hypothetical protein ACRDOE_07205 [Streptosporangiaceae bacterium]
MAPKQVREAAAWMGRKSYRVRLEKFGIARLQQIARDNGKLGGRPRKQSKEAGK